MNERTNMTDELDAAEGLIAGGQANLAVELLERLAADAEEYVDRNCPTTDEVQWFSFPTIFERLCYRRVEKDPRELKDVGEPLDRLYADLAFALVNEGDYAAATEALRRAVRWNPMGCGYRLDLAELYRTNGDVTSTLPSRSPCSSARVTCATSCVPSATSRATSWTRAPTPPLPPRCAARAASTGPTPFSRTCSSA